MLRRAAPKVSPILVCVWIWLIPSCWYSTGSSTVMILVVSSLISFSAEYRGGGLPGPGRAGDEDDPVRPVDELLERAVDVRQHPAVLQVERHPALVEEPHHDPLAVDHRG
jgi:hypothetical protein